MNSKTQGSLKATSSNWNRKASIMAILAATCLLTAYGAMFIDRANRVLTPDPHELLAMSVFVFLPLNVLSIIFSFLAIKNAIQIRSIRGKQNSLTLILLLSIVAFWVYRFATN
jgi:hypothetical protein